MQLIRRFAKRIRHHFRQASERIIYEFAKAYRPQLSKVCFIGVTGSCGKTTTNELIGAILSSRYTGRTSRQLYNGPNHIARTILTVFPWHQFYAHETGSSGPGIMAKSLRILKPKIGVVTHIGSDHHASFRTLDATAAEKGKLIEALPVGGAAILNADDPRVLAMRALTRARVITYGLSQQAMVRGEEVYCDWPDRLSLAVVYGSARVRIRTRLLGEHWSYAVLAALATGIAVGISLTNGARIVVATCIVMHRPTSNCLTNCAREVTQPLSLPASASRTSLPCNSSRVAFRLPGSLFGPRRGYGEHPELSSGLGKDCLRRTYPQRLSKRRVW
jgi:UDP-N-acetylmuramyl pentapeptide synthase